MWKVGSTDFYCLKENGCKKSGLLCLFILKIWENKPIAYKSEYWIWKQTTQIKFLIGLCQSYLTDFCIILISPLFFVERNLVFSFLMFLVRSPYGYLFQGNKLKENNITILLLEIKRLTPLQKKLCNSEFFKYFLLCFILFCNECWLKRVSVSLDLSRKYEWKILNKIIVMN